ncbi:MAG: ATP-binding cassette domain-containing protein [Prevotella sp.]|nr:ATP-binding cassette domain-containing protein [Prevotella sp.]
MPIYLDQIEKRRRLEEAALNEALARSQRRLGFKGKQKAQPQDDTSALRQVLDALGVTNYELEENEMMSPEEQLTGILRPRGIMMRKIKLEGQWWRESVGPLLGYSHDGHLLALTPTYWNMGYCYRNAEGETIKVSRKAMNEHISSDAITFTKPLPLRKLRIQDLLRFCWSVVPSPNYAFVLLAALAVVLLGMFTPMANKLIFDTVIPTGDAADLMPICGLLLGATLGTMLITLTRDFYIDRVQDIMELHMQNAVMARTFLLSPKFFLQNASGELSARLNNVTILCKLINENIVGALLSSALSVIYLIQLWIYGQQLLLPALFILATWALVILLLYRRTTAIREQYTQKASTLSGMEYNMFAGIQKLKLTGSEKRAFTRWLNHYTDAAQLIYNPGLRSHVYPALMQLLSIGGLAMLYYFTLKHNVSTSDFIAFSSAFGMMTAAMNQLSNIIDDLASVQPLLKSTLPIMEAVPETEAKAPQIEDIFGSIEVSGLCFRYDKEQPPVFEDFSLNIAPGEYVGIVGKSGCGKSTLLRLLLGFETPQAGSIYYDTYDLSQVDKTSLRRKIGTCLQSGSLFTGDLFHNITITAPWATEDDVWEALRLAALDEDVRQMPMQLHTMVSEGGGGFSGGQKQRLLIARALIAHPTILLFDEATSALDNISQKQVSDNIAKLACTRIVIAHRLSTIRHCDRIIVLDQGHIAEEGTFEELMANKGLFYEISQRQL